MKLKFLSASLLGLIFIAILIPLKSIQAQTPTAEPGVNWIMITFDQPPTTVTVEKAPLRYNKTFAMSFHNDDGIADIYTEGFPFFTGNPVGTNNYPGLFYTDGTGNEVSFKLSSNLYSFNGVNGPDMHQPGNGYGVVTWTQLAEMYNNGCGIYNHGISSDASTDDAFMHYSVARNESFIRRQLYEATPGGVQTRIFVNPNGNVAYSPVAFELGNFHAFNQSSQAVIGNNGGDVNAYADWNVPADLNRLIAENTNVMQLADNLFANSTNGANYWAPIFTHSIINQYPLADFHADWNYIAQTYGSDGLDNVWVTSEEEIISYLKVRQRTNLSYGLAGNTLLITLNGDIPADMRFYPLSLLVDADAQIASIQINGGTNNTFNGIGQTSSLINLEWDGRYIPDIVQLADSYVSIAENTQAQYDCWIAMDYVSMVAVGPERNALRDRLCAIENVAYDPGFCESCDFSLGNDTTLCQFNCVTLTAPFAEGNTYLWSNDSTTQSITICPEVTTSYWVQLTTIGGCIASDTLVVNVLPAPEFDLGNDVFACIGDTLTLIAPADDTWQYSWFANGNPLTETSNILVFPLADTTLIRLDIEGQNGCVATDSLTAFAWDVPSIQINPANTTLCLGESVLLSLTVLNADAFEWWNGSTSQNIIFEPTEADSTYRPWAIATNGYGCHTSDTAIVQVFQIPTVNLTVTQGNDSICIGETIGLTATISDNVQIATLNWNEQETIENPPLVNLKTISPTVSGWYTVSIMSVHDCGTSDSIYLYVELPPSMTITNDTALCRYDTIRLGASGGISCQWLLGSEIIGETYTLSVSPADTSTYYALITADSPLGCSSRDSVNVVVHPKPQLVSLVTDTTLCSGSSITITIEGADNYLWSNGMTGPSNDLELTETLDLTLIGTSVFGCADTLSVHLGVFPSVETSFTGLMPVYCQNDPPTVLIGIPEGGLFAGRGIVDSLFDPALAGDGQHLITYTFTDENLCTKSFSIQTLVFGGLSEIYLGPDSSLCPNDFIMLDAGAGFSQYFWSNGATTQTIVVGGNEFPPATTHEISVVGVLDGCTASGKMQLSIRNDCFIGQVENTTENLLSIIPNPNSGRFMVQWHEKETPEWITLTNINGTKVINTALQPSDPAIQFELPGLTKGLYIISLRTNTRVYTTKLIVE